jgi:hypothetical protein
LHQPDSQPEAAANLGFGFLGLKETDMLTMAWKHLSLGPIVLIACIVLCGEAMAFQNVMSPFARSRIYSCDSAPASTRRTQRARDGALHLAATGRREVLLASVASGLLLVQPAGATDFRKAVEIFGSDGDLPPGFAEQVFRSEHARMSFSKDWINHIDHIDQYNA